MSQKVIGGVRGGGWEHAPVNSVSRYYNHDFKPFFPRKRGLGSREIGLFHNARFPGNKKKIPEKCKLYLGGGGCHFCNERPLSFRVRQDVVETCDLIGAKDFKSSQFSKPRGVNFPARPALDPL